MEYQYTGNTTQPEEQVSDLEQSKEDQEYQYLLDMHDILAEQDPLNAPKLSVLEAWKLQHKHIYISRVVDPDTYYVWRVLKRGEYKKLSHNEAFANPSSANEILVETCLLYPIPDQAWRIMSPAGVIESLGKQISFQSGFVPDNELIGLIRVV